MEGLWEELAEEGKESFIFKPSDSHFESDCHFFITLALITNRFTPPMRYLYSSSPRIKSNLLL